MIKLRFDTVVELIVLITDDQIEIIVVPTEGVVIEAALLSRSARLLKLHFLIIIVLLIGVADDVLKHGIDFKKEAIGGAVILGLYTTINTFFKWRFVKNVRKCFRRLKQEEIKYKFTADALILSSVVGEENINWNKINRIMASPRILVFCSIGNITVPLPIAFFNEDIKKFVHQKVKAYQIKLFGRCAKALLG